MSVPLTWVCPLLVALSVLSCGDDKKCECVFSPEGSNLPAGALYGRILSPQPGTEVTLTQGDPVQTTVIRSDGSFTFSGLQQGFYGLLIEAPDGSGRVLVDVQVVSDDYGTNLGLLELSDLPLPIMECQPADGDTLSTNDSRIRIITMVPVHAESVATLAEFTPPIPGTWRESWSTGNYLFGYEFDPDDRLPLGARYDLTLHEPLMSTNGLLWSPGFSSTFYTPPFQIEGISWNINASVPLAPSYQGDLVYIQFNADIDPSTMASSINLEPDCSYTVQFPYYNHRALSVRIDGGLTAGARYVVSLGATLRDVDGNQARPRTIGEFAVEAFRMTSRYVYFSNPLPYQSRHSVLFQDVYNAALDFQSLPSAIRAEPPVVLRFDGDGTSYQVSIDSSQELIPGAEHRIIAGPGIRSIDGEVTATSDTVVVRLEPLSVGEVDVWNVDWPEREVEPGTALNAVVTMSSSVDKDQFALAARFEPHLSGAWTSSQYSRERVSFLMGAGYLEPEQTYRLIIRGDIPLIGEATLGEDYVYEFQVEPVKVRDTYPDDGATEVYRDTDVEVTFNSTMNQESTESAFRLEDEYGGPVPGSFSWSEFATTLVYQPQSALQPGMLYHVSTSTGATDAYGHALKDPLSLHFRTGSW